MTVIEIIRKYKLEDFQKDYKNQYGDYCGVKFPLNELAQMQVKSVDINFPTNHVIITIIER